VTPSDMVLEDRNGEVRAHAEDLPNPDVLPGLRIYQHSSLMYWWPVWLAGYVFAIWTWLQGGYVELDEVRRELFHVGSEIGLIYVLILTFVILFTNFKLRGIYSVAFMLAVGLMITLIALAGWWDAILSYIPYLSIHMNMGFYLVFSTILFIAWLFSFFVFDRLVYYLVRPGQLIRVSRIGGNEETWDARGMLVEERADDYFRHYVLGLGSGDLTINTSGAKSEVIHIQNVLLANRKMKIIQQLVAVEPTRLMPESQ
jgi:hypothetical protein